MKIPGTFIGPLKDVLNKMGATVAQGTPYATVELDPLTQLRQELEVGRDIVDIAEVENVFGGLLSVDGQQIIVYIKATHHPKELLIKHPKKSKKFHVSWCETLDKMLKEGRYERYVATTSKSGRFSVEWEDPHTNETGEISAELAVCRHCLDYLKWEKFSIKDTSREVKNNIVNEFNIESFFREYSTFFSSKPRFTDITAPLGHYVKQWPEISRAYRASKDWKCEKCGVDCAGNKGLLHTHHKNGRREENFDHNLQALCALCHSLEPMHSHMKMTEETNSRILALRREQDLA